MSSCPSALASAVEDPKGVVSIRPGTTPYVSSTVRDHRLSYICGHVTSLQVTKSESGLTFCIIYIIPYMTNSWRLTKLQSPEKRGVTVRAEVVKELKKTPVKNSGAECTREPRDHKGCVCEDSRPAGAATQPRERTREPEGRGGAGNPREAAMGPRQRGVGRLLGTDGDREGAEGPGDSRRGGEGCHEERGRGEMRQRGARSSAAAAPWRYPGGPSGRGSSSGGGCSCTHRAARAPSQRRHRNLARAERSEPSAAP